MDTIQNLVLLYAGLLLINCGLAAWLWASTRERLYRMVLFVWASSAAGFVAQGLLATGDLEIVLGFTPVLLVNLALAHLVSNSLGQTVRWQPYAALTIAAVLLSAALHYAGFGFSAVALPVSIAVSLPCLVTAFRVLQQKPDLTASTKALLISSVLFSLHNIDFAFLRNQPQLAPVGFTVAILIVVLLSITAPAVALERVTAERSRIATEMATTRRIQTQLLPKDESLGAFEVVTFVRSAEQVGGDYFDVCPAGDGCWLMLGDVTGHGIGAGLVMLMAQSTISAILDSSPGIAPRELNFLANRVLSRNLARLGEQRHMTIVTIHTDNDGRLLISGSHDNIYLLRSATGEVETMELAHFPLGIGYTPDLERSQFGEDAAQLEPGDLLFIGSDGVTECARGGDYRSGVFGEERLVGLLRENASSPLDELRDRLLEQLDEYSNGVYNDDVSFLMLRTAPKPAVVAYA